MYNSYLKNYDILCDTKITLFFLLILIIHHLNIQEWVKNWIKWSNCNKKKYKKINRYPMHIC